MSSSIPRLSLVVATCDRPGVLARLFASLRRQTCQEFEVLVADQSRPENQAAMTALCQELPGRGGLYQHLHRRGLSRSRNAVLGRCRGDVIAFPDDDCWYPDDLVASVLARLDAEPGLDLLSICWGEPDRRHPMFAARAQAITAWGVFRCASSITIFVRREALGGLRFDERLGAGAALAGGEEMDLLLNLLRRGQRGWYEPAIRAFHPISPPGPQHLVFDRAYGALLNRHARHLPVLALKAVLGLAKQALGAIARPAQRPHLAARLSGLVLPTWRADA